MHIKQFQYMPVLKTTDAELKAFDKLDATVKDGVLPLFELTRSRTTSKNREGAIDIRFGKLKEVLNGRPFILDLTQEPTLSNKEIERFLDSTTNGFAEWRAFVGGMENVIPIIHYNENASDADTLKQAQELEKRHQTVAFRIDVYDLNTQSYFRKIVNCLQRPEEMVVVLDAGYVSVQSWGEAATPMRARIKEISRFLPVANFFSACSSFPKTVIAPGYGQDDSGEFSLVEIDVHAEARKENPNIKYGDYGSIHPVRYPIGGGGWIPRIDVALEKKCFYHRERAAKGKIKDAYVNVAQYVANDGRYKKIGNKLNVWGDAEIKSAAEGTPNGISPSHWISVRANLHITRQYFRTKN